MAVRRSAKAKQLELSAWGLGFIRASSPSSWLDLFRAWSAAIQPASNPSVEWWGQKKERARDPAFVVQERLAFVCELPRLHKIDRDEDEEQSKGNRAGHHPGRGANHSEQVEPPPPEDFTHIIGVATPEP
eukprot:CAMPEP_0172632066 /NCGR_PEP_ID=MMETSP1068-20121228/182549_1 /TAXON_ID=35684 /ORGANISM="Pseudopedinella elastica, Strain CCMP716" /LENGTH=129 /DNA_ID=CAMNT_0013443367 /DNA_START=89 /DNA_END=479 /DNA_ORIENTATION=-